MTKNKLLVILILVIVVFLLFNAPRVNFPKTRLPLLSIVEDQRDQLKSEYTTLWGGLTDSAPSTSICRDPAGFGYPSLTANQLLTKIDSGEIKKPPYPFCVSNGGTHYEDELMNIDGSSFSSDGEYGGRISVSSGSSSITFKKKFKGQEIALLFITGGDAVFSQAPRFAEAGTITKIILKPHTLESNKWDIIFRGENVQTITGNNPDGSLTLSWGIPQNSAVNIIYIGYKLESCEITKDEVWVTERYGSQVTIKDLTFESFHFCYKEHPPILRRSSGEEAIYPNPFNDFNRGFPIPQNRLLTSDEQLSITYSTYYVNGIIDPLSPDKQWVCVSRDTNNKCSKWEVKSFVEEVKIIVGCQQDSDCYVPTKPQCFGYFKGCQNNKCVYDENIPDSLVCKNEVVTIIKQIQEVEKRIVVPATGANSFTFSQNNLRTSFNIGDQTFIATPPQYLCQVPIDTDFLNAPSPSSDCWQTTITYEGKSYTFKDTTIIKPNELIQIQYFAGGKLTNGQFRKPEDWSNSFIFTINTLNAFQIQGAYGETVLQNSDLHLKFNIINNLPKGDVVIKVRQTVRATGKNLPEQLISTIFNNGNNTIDIQLDSKNLGLNDIYVDVFYKIKADVLNLIPAGSISVTYNIVTELPLVTKINYIDITQEITNPTPVKEIPTKKSIVVKVILGIIIIFILFRIFS